MTEQLIRELEALKVGADEVLILRLSEAWMEDGEQVPALMDALTEIGLDGRVIVLAGGVEMAVVKREA